MAKISILHLKDEPTTDLENILMQNIKDDVMMKLPPDLIKYIDEEPGEIVFQFDQAITKIQVRIKDFDDVLAEQIKTFVEGSKIYK